MEKLVYRRLDNNIKSVAEFLRFIIEIGTLQIEHVYIMFT